MSLCCVLFAAWVGSMRAKAEQHRRESAAIVRRISDLVTDPKQLERDVAEWASSSDELIPRPRGEDEETEVVRRAAIKARYDVWRWNEAVRKAAMIRSHESGFIVTTTFLIENE